jgi:hypothetical protein
VSLGDLKGNSSSKETDGDQGMYYCIHIFFGLGGNLMSNCSVSSS